MRPSLPPTPLTMRPMYVTLYIWEAEDKYVNLYLGHFSGQWLRLRDPLGVRKRHLSAKLNVRHRSYAIICSRSPAILNFSHVENCYEKPIYTMLYKYIKLTLCDPMFRMFSSLYISPQFLAWPARPGFIGRWGSQYLKRCDQTACKDHILESLLLPVSR